MNSGHRSGYQPHVVAVCGSRRNGSYTRRVLHEALSGARTAGGTVELLDLADLELSPLDPDKPSADTDVLRRTIREADAVILGTPMYHGSYSGVLKNAIDHCGSEEFEDMTVGLVAVSGGPFPTAALDHLRIVCRSLNARVLPHQAAIPEARTMFDEHGLTDDELQERVRKVGIQMVEHASIAPERVRVVCDQGCETVS